jgi:hypothetical protein
MMKLSRWRAKNEAPARLPSPKAGSARQPKDAVQVDETVRVPQDFINGIEVTRIDFGLVTKLSAVVGRHLVKPSDLAHVLC